MIKDYIKLVIVSLSQRKLRSWLTMIGIFIGIAAVVSLISLGQGLQEAVTSQFTSLGTDRLLVQAAGAGFGPPGAGAVKKLTEDDLKVVRKVKGIEQAASRLIRLSKVSFRDSSRFSYIGSIPQDDSRKLIMEVIEQSYTSEPVEQGRMLEKDDKYKVVVANRYSTTNLLSRKIRVGDKLIIEGKEFEVIGILRKTGNPFGGSIILMNEGPMKEIFGIDNEVDLIYAKVDKGENVEAVTERVEKALRKERNVELGKEDFKVETPLQAIETLNNILGYVTTFLVFISLISLFVGGIGIMNTMYTAVLERTREIGIMKAIGARNSHILLLFLMESGTLGMIGGLIGILLGVLLSKSVEWIAFASLGTSLVKAEINILLLVLPLLFSFLVGTISGIFPALQAASLKPVDALRK